MVCDGCVGFPLPGVLVSLDAPEGIQRCDACAVFPGDLEAAAALAAAFVEGVGGSAEVVFERSDGATVSWDGQDLPEGTWIEEGTNPWLLTDGGIVPWAAWAKVAAGRRTKCK